MARRPVAGDVFGSFGLLESLVLLESNVLPDSTVLWLEVSRRYWQVQPVQIVRLHSELQQPFLELSLRGDPSEGTSQDCDINRCWSI